MRPRAILGSRGFELFKSKAKDNRQDRKENPQSTQRRTVPMSSLRTSRSFFAIFAVKGFQVLSVLALRVRSSGAH
jgi:hypothetical protein